MREKGKHEKKKVHTLHGANDVVHSGVRKKQVYENKGKGKGKECPLPQKLPSKRKFLIWLQRPVPSEWKTSFDSS